jgi:ABC-2 type transport system ATP-binding protein
VITDTGHPAWLFELRDVTHHYGRVRALRELTIRVPVGAVALVGQNGAGKSTLMQILLGLIRPECGSAWVLGQGVHRQPLALRGRIGYMSEREAFVTGLKGVEYVALAGQLSGMPGKQAWRRAHETLSYLGMEEARYRQLEEYSVGMKQRLKLAAALVHDPDVLLLDEPTAGLDPEGRSAMLAVLHALGSRAGKSLLLSTHLLSDVERICQQAVILDRGELLHSGPLSDLRRARPRNYLLRWQGDGGDAWLQALRRLGVEMNRPIRPGEAHVTVPETWSNRDFFRQSLRHPIVITGIEPEEDDLESIYQHLVQEQEKGNSDA